MAQSKVAWCFCPTCHEFLLINNTVGVNRAFPLGNKARTLISSLVSEQAQNPAFASQIDRLLGELRERGGIGEEPLTEGNLPAPAKPKRTRKKKT